MSEITDGAFKYPIVSEDVVPYNKGRWQRVFDLIPTGMAIIVQRSDADLSSARTCLRREKSKGRFKEYAIVSESDKFYIVHHKEALGGEGK